VFCFELGEERSVNVDKNVLIFPNRPARVVCLSTEAGRHAQARPKQWHARIVMNILRYIWYIWRPGSQFCLSLQVTASHYSHHFCHDSFFYNHSASYTKEVRQMFPHIPDFMQLTGLFCRSQWPHGLRHKLSSFTRMLGSWLRIPLKAWMSVCVYSIWVVLCLGRGLATGWSLVQGVLPSM
jgi:hypothetical protein